ncbi:helix-turn-helix transcriptional regulator, partial [Elizabethkingia anophelis]
LNLHPDFSSFVFFETRKPTGLEHFYDLFFAIRNKRVVTFEHFSYQTRLMTSRKVQPLALKESKNRWYLIAVDTKDKALKSFGLDRINYMEVSNGKFREKYNLNFKEHFQNAFGVMNLAEQKPERIVLKCSRHQGEYIRSFPLHTSQKSFRETPQHIWFEFFLHPTYDFMQEVLSFGQEAVILEPICLSEQITAHLKNALKNYE